MLAPAAAPRIAALAGPTAAGKTAAAVALRRDFGLPIEAIGFDALQVYRRLDAGTAKPDACERAALPYHLIDCIEPTEAMTAGRYAALADAAIAQVRSHGAWPLLVGGTGLYLRAVVRGLADIPEVPVAIREELAAELAARGPDALHAELAGVDPHYAATVPAANRQRVLRALEVWRATGRPFSAFHREQAAHLDRFACFTALVDPPRAELDARIEARARAMTAPLLAEVRDLLAAGLLATAPAMQALGYREAVAVLRGDLPEPDFAAALVRAHRQYAKRQRTWFHAVAVDRCLTTAGAVELGALAADLRRWFAPGTQP